MSTSPISSSSGFPPPASLPDDTQAQGSGDGPEILEVDDYQAWTPRNGGLADARDRPLPSPGLGGSTHGGQPTPPAPGQGQTPNPIADTGTPGTGTGKPQVGGDTAPPGAGMRPPGGADTGTRPGINPGGQHGGGYPSTPGQNGQGNGFGLGNGYGLGNGNNGYGLGSTLGSLTNGLLGRGGVLAAPLAMLNGAAQGGLGNVLAHATPIPLATPNALPNAAAVPAHTPASIPNAPAHATPTAATATGTSPFAGAHANAANASNPSNAATLPRAAATTTTPATTHPGMPAPTSTATPLAAPLRGGAIVENAPAQPAGLRTVNADPAHAGTSRSQAGTANDGLHAQSTAQAANAARQGNVQALAPSAGVLTLMVSPHAELASEDTRATANSTLFREQGVDGRENVRDILGRTYVFTADGKLITRAQERAGVDAVDPTLTEELDEVSMSNHGELSTHDLLFKVVVPAFAGMAALLGGATAGAGIATGASGMGGSFLLLAAAAVLGYGATRAIANLRELAATGADLSPLASRAAMTHWVAAGTQSTGSLAAVALMLF